MQCSSVPTAELGVLCDEEDMHAADHKRDMGVGAEHDDTLSHLTSDTEPSANEGELGDSVNHEDEGLAYALLDVLDVMVARGVPVMEIQAVMWYLEQFEMAINTEAELLEEQERIGAVIRWLLERGVIEVRSSSSNSSMEMRVIGYRADAGNVRSAMQAVPPGGGQAGARWYAIPERGTDGAQKALV